MVIREGVVSNEGGFEDKISSGSTVMLYDNFMTSSQAHIANQNLGKSLILNDASPKVRATNDGFLSAFSSVKV